MADFKPQAFDDEAVLHSEWPKDEVGGSNPITRVTAVSAAGVLEVEWSDRGRQSYPNVWLRDHCRCPKCFHAGFQTRLTDFMELDFDTAIKTVSVSDDGRLISITWSDDHESRFPSDWLVCNRFDQSGTEPVSAIEPVLWNARECAERTPRFKYQEIIESDEVLHEMLMQLKVLGLALIQDTPTEKGHVSKLSDRIGYIQTTSYGTTSQIYGKEDWAFGHPSYGVEYRPLHTDYSFCSQPPGVGLMHCIEQIVGEGGAHFFVDGFKAVADLKESNPAGFNRLTLPCWESRVKGWVVNDKHYHYARHAPISVNTDGEVTKLAFSDFWRTSVMRLPVNDVVDTYKAMRAFYNLLYRKDYTYTHRLEPGDVLIFNNHRILHGREEYRNTTPSQVHLETCYFDWDSVDSRLRKLKMTLGK